MNVYHVHDTYYRSAEGKRVGNSNVCMITSIAHKFFLFAPKSKILFFFPSLVSIALSLLTHILIISTGIVCILTSNYYWKKRIKNKVEKLVSISTLMETMKYTWFGILDHCLFSIFIRLLLLLFMVNFIIFYL